MKILISLAILLVCSFQGEGQIELERQVIGSIGGYVETTELDLSYTIGETIVTKQEPFGLIITQGFHQFDETFEPCLGDFNFDGERNAADLLSLLGGFGCEMDCEVDLDGDDVVGASDLLIFLSVFGIPC